MSRKNPENQFSSVDMYMRIPLFESYSHHSDAGSNHSHFVFSVRFDIIFVVSDLSIVSSHFAQIGVPSILDPGRIPKLWQVDALEPVWMYFW